MKDHSSMNAAATSSANFARTELALEQERYFQSKALANQIAGVSDSAT